MPRIRIHREGRIIIRNALVVSSLLVLVAYLVFPGMQWAFYISLFVIAGILGGILYFFRSPERILVRDATTVVSPADGKIVALEHVSEEGNFDGPVRKISVFMSPLNVHLNRVPVDGKVVHYRYHPGKYLVAWHPKSSALNERNTLVIETHAGHRIMVRQIAGTVARRIVCYCKEGQEVVQGEELGFIKFGSRVDLFLPPDAQILVEKGEKVRAGITPLALLS